MYSNLQYNTWLIETNCYVMLVIWRTQPAQILQEGRQPQSIRQPLALLLQCQLCRAAQDCTKQKGLFGQVEVHQWENFSQLPMIGRRALWGCMQWISSLEHGWVQHLMLSWMISGLLGGDPWLYRVNLTSHQVLGYLIKWSIENLVSVCHLRNQQWWVIFLYMDRNF